MTAEEFSHEFDIEYNNITSNLAAPLNEYEKSVFLTKAQETLVLYSIRSFENNEQSRKLLMPLIETAAIKENSHNLDNMRISPNSIFFMLPDDLMSIVYEEIRIKNSFSDKCLAGKVLEVYPTTHDAYYRTAKNPFAGGSKRRAMRIDVSVGDSNQGTIHDLPSAVIDLSNLPSLVVSGIEIYTNETVYGKMSEIVYANASLKGYIDSYFIRYIRVPHPIITDSIPSGYYVNGKNTKSECELESSIHRQIVETAANLAAEAYKKVEPQK